MYESLTKYLVEIASDEKGTWIASKKKNDGTLVLPYVSYSRMVRHFTDDVYSFVCAHEDLGLNHYFDILKAHGIRPGGNSMSTVAIEQGRRTAVVNFFPSEA